MLTIAICDNNQAVISELSRMLAEQFPQDLLRILGFDSRKALEDGLKHGLQPDILFADVMLGEDNGVHMVKELFPSEGPTQVIYISAYPSASSEVYLTDHTYFLTKPIQERQLQTAISRALERSGTFPQRYLLLRSRGSLERIPLSSIRYLESAGRKVLIHSREGTYEQNATLSSVAADLTEHFIQCHKSFYVNMQYIRHLEPRHIVLDNGTEIPISQTRKTAAREAIGNFLMEQ